MTNSEQHTEHSEHHTEHKHIVEYGKYLFIWLGLLALTGITVSAAGINLGNWTIVLALVIASVKSLLVLSIFMHLKFEDKVFKIFVWVAMLTFAIFIFFTFLDYSFIR